MFDTSITVMIVDDMMTMRKIVAKSMRELGFANFVEAADGQKAWELLNSTDSKVNLVISDWNMPNCTGLDLLKRVRGDARTKDMPFILLTAESEQAQVIEAVKAGVDQYIRKPFSPDILQIKLNEAYKKRYAKAA